MPRTCKKQPRKSRNEHLDVKLSDFADSSPRAGRLRKCAGESLESDNILTADDLLWYEKDLEEFEIFKVAEAKKKKSRSRHVSEECSDDAHGIRYPIDVWFLIGQFIMPEDVKIFASICKDSYFVSRSYSFWIRMYKRFYEPGVHLPPRLQPACIEQSYSLKTCVVRALYQMYPQFTAQISSQMSDDAVYHLSNLCCTLMWRSQQNGKWWFHFKFQSTSGNTQEFPLTYSLAIKRLWTSHDRDDSDAPAPSPDVYINHNPDEGCKVLQFACAHFVAVPNLVMGRRLSDVRVHLAHDLRHHKLELTFCQGNYRQSVKSSSCREAEVVEFDAIENLSVLNWWHPQYPSEYKV